MLAFLLRHVVVVVAHKVPLTFYSCYDLKVSISILLPLYALRFVIVVTLLEFQMYLSSSSERGKMEIEGQQWSKSLHYLLSVVYIYFHEKICTSYK